MIRIKNKSAHDAFVTHPDLVVPAPRFRPGEGFSKPVAPCTIAPVLPVTPLEGGEMIVMGEVIGAVGVSGVKSSDDTQIAGAGIAAIGAAYSL